MIINALEEAIKFIPTYGPLPDFIATNPLWDRHEQSFESVLLEVSALIDIQGTMPLSFYQKMFTENKILKSDLTEAIKATSLGKYDDQTIDRLEKILLKPRAGAACEGLSTHHILSSPILMVEHIANVTQKDLKMDIQKSIIQFLMDYFCQFSQMDLEGKENGIFYVWWASVAKHNTLLHAVVTDVKTDKYRLLSHMLDAFNIPQDLHTDYLKKIFFSVLGWFSFIKYLEHTPNHPYLKVRAKLIDVALIWLCYETYYAKQYECDHLTQHIVQKKTDSSFKNRLIWQHAYEIAYARELMSKLTIHTTDKDKKTADYFEAQAIFCIDTRSEGIRRHFEKKGLYETFGAAGFFGFVFHYEKSPGCHRLQCPGLFLPEIYLKNERQAAYHEMQSKHFLALNHIVKKSLFSPMVWAEIAGFWFSLMMLIKTTSLRLFEKIKNYSGAGNNHKKILDHLSPHQVNRAFSLDKKVNQAKQFLFTIGLTKSFAPLVLICGHGAEMDNNPYQASFNCGACGGNAGLSNAIVAAHILNDHLVRKKLQELGIDIPQETYFIACFHNTTRDEVVFYDMYLPKHLKSTYERVKEDINHACTLLRAERSQTLSGTLSYNQRAIDWAELIPEMGLINNAAFIIGPRYITEHVSLDRRVFLHSYDPTQDVDGTLLEGILLGPLIVTHWINAQYYFSTTDHNVYGSGNKMLHNVLPQIGVMEGHFSDLKIGLPWQSIAFQHNIVHQPLRLLVVIYAAQTKVEAILEKHATIRALFRNQWAHVKVIEPSGV